MKHTCKLEGLRPLEFLRIKDNLGLFCPALNYLLSKLCLKLVVVELVII